MGFTYENENILLSNYPFINIMEKVLEIHFVTEEEVKTTEENLLKEFDEGTKERRKKCMQEDKDLRLKREAEDKDLKMKREMDDLHLKNQRDGEDMVQKERLKTKLREQRRDGYQKGVDKLEGIENEIKKEERLVYERIKGVMKKKLDGEILETALIKSWEGSLN